jgi:hypothetical protein
MRAPRCPSRAASARCGARRLGGAAARRGIERGSARRRRRARLRAAPRSSRHAARGIRLERELRRVAVERGEALADVGEAHARAERLAEAAAGVGDDQAQRRRPTCAR